MFDGVALFDNAHNNLIATGAAPSVDTLQAIMLKLLSQKDPFGDSIMVEPEYLIVPVGYGFKMSQLLETALIDVTGNWQPHRKRAVQVPDPAPGGGGGHDQCPGRNQCGALVHRRRQVHGQERPGGLPERR